MIFCISFLLLVLNIVYVAFALSNSPKISFRKARVDDMGQIATLMVDVFDEVPGWNVVQRKIAENGYKMQLGERMESGCTSMIVACDEIEDRIAAFLELGTMPSPVPVVTVWEGMETETRPEIPYLGNLAVSPLYRRQKIGTRMVKLACRMAAKWSAPLAPGAEGEGEGEGGAKGHEHAIFLAVDADNFAAIRMYGALEFDIILDETQEISRPANRPPRLFFKKALGREAVAVQQVLSDSEK